MSDTPDDAVRKRLLTCAAACLTHIRTVRWGVATSQYVVEDGDGELSVHVEIRCLTKKKDDLP